MRAISATALAGALLASAGLAGAQAPPAPGQHQASDLPTLLHLRPDQLTAFHALEAAGREPPAVIAQLRAKQQRLINETTPQRLDFEAEAADLQDKHQHRVWAALRKFYAVLTPEQQRQFDQLTAPHPQQAPAQH
jgi:Spy/CpxP family protein refolding chaperone